MRMSSSAGVRGSVEAIESYETIEQAVLETPRGRWFLAEYARRQRGKELDTVLEAMHRLERALGVKQAAAAAGDPVGRRIAKAINTAAPGETAPAAPAALEAKHLKYFRKDEEIFTAAPAPAPTPAPIPVAVAEAHREPRGAKLIIRRKSQPLPEPVPAAEEAAPPAAPAVLATPVATAETEPKRRIVIIRHKMGEDIDVPLHGELAVEV